MKNVLVLGGSSLVGHGVIKFFLEKMSKENKLISYNLNDVLNFYKENQGKFENNKKKKIKGYDVNTRLDWKKII